MLSPLEAVTCIIQQIFQAIDTLEVFCQIPRSKAFHFIVVLVLRSNFQPAVRDFLAEVLYRHVPHIQREFQISREIQAEEKDTRESREKGEDNLDYK